MESTALKKLQATCTALKDEMTALYDQRGSRHCDESYIKKRRWNLLLHLCAMKSGLRDTFLESDARRTRVQEQKNLAETHQLQLQNLLYEKDHLLREIQSCRGFSTKELDKIDFVDGPIPIQVDADVHRQHLNQLTQELNARKRLQAELKEIKAKIAVINNVIETKQTFLDELPHHLAGIEAATMGLQEYMGQNITVQRNEQQVAGTELPTPLYALYCELEAYQMASGEAGKQLRLEIVDSIGIKYSTLSRKRGFPSALERQNVSAAEKRLKASSRSPSISVTVETPPHNRAPSRSPSSKRKIDCSTPEPEIGEIVVPPTAEKLLELRPHEDETKEERSLLKHLHQQQDDNTDSKLCRVQNLWEPHAKALQLVVSITTPSSTGNISATFIVMFQYFPVAKMVTAEIVETAPAGLNFGSHRRNILMYLFPGDDGLTVPQLVVNYAFQEDDKACMEIEYPINAACRPYYWTQWICGLNPMKRPDPSISNADPSDDRPPRRPEPSIRNVMNQLINRFVATTVLMSHLDQLAKVSSKSIEDHISFVHPLAQHIFPREIQAHLEEWIEIPTPSQDLFQLFKETTTLLKRPRAQCHLSTTGCRYFRAGFQHGHTKVSAIVEISPEYPVRAPRFLFQPRLTMSNKALDKDSLLVYENQLKELEIEVNAYYDELIPQGTEHYLLFHQLPRERRGKDRRHAMVMDTEANCLRHR
ncbi:Conserved coiled/coiled coil protein [Plasmopara halstedii]|uniref:Conserved coiled/coiled coil protein n=1 Tax=Plasmopara halstedii TaxID=4781 RepID=A0A0P1B7G5_PLAHL|nr:Conserved coiled/coiled coil protein [Plasmopara halstedii]CEG50134.1 Conserved coiled/coiled coil protein [Plasmopara halstedii]|eukprot:XP_024586503.1 Conserved coiled/coiled coil protein [Plasmopara halstedii]